MTREQSAEIARSAVSYVSEHPGCTSDDVRRHLKLLPQHAGSILRRAAELGKLDKKIKRKNIGMEGPAGQMGGTRKIAVWYPNEVKK